MHPASAKAAPITNAATAIDLLFDLREITSIMLPFLSHWASRFGRSAAAYFCFFGSTPNAKWLKDAYVFEFWLRASNLQVRLIVEGGGATHW